MTTVAQAISDLTQRFSSVDTDTPRLDARILVAHVLGLDPSLLFARSAQVLSAAEMEALMPLADRRLDHEPVSKIIGVREFYGLPFKVTRDTLDPRPDTETIVTAALRRREAFGSKPARILDLGTGTGCILLALLKEWPEAGGVGVDVSMSALTVARENAEHLGLAARARFVEGDWRTSAAAGLEAERFDIIVSNPPYVTAEELANLAPSVRRFDPEVALLGGPDGLDAYRMLLPLARPLLADDGGLFLEIGAGQADAVGKLAENAGFEVIAKDRDLAGFVRCLTATVASKG